MLIMSAVEAAGPYNLDQIYSDYSLYVCGLTYDSE